MQYAILVYETPSELAAREDPTRVGGYWAAYTAYSQALGQAGVAAGGAGLQAPSVATTLRVRGGQRQVQDGPFADTKELLGGLFIIDVPDLDAALEWASRCPSAATGSVEVRPVLPPPPGV
ncbi:MAG: YciI family protein [Gemmatimonadota bacterium]